MHRSDQRFAEWTAAERAEYAAVWTAAQRAEYAGPATGPAPPGDDAPRSGPAIVPPVAAVLRETLRALDAEPGADEQVRRELARAGASQEPVA